MTSIVNVSPLSNDAKTSVYSLPLGRPHRDDDSW